MSGISTAITKKAYLTLMPEQVKRPRSYLTDVMKSLTNRYATFLLLKVLTGWDGGMWDITRAFNIQTTI
jgi:hypothetical protein